MTHFLSCNTSTNTYEQMSYVREIQISDAIKWYQSSLFLGNNYSGDSFRFIYFSHYGDQKLVY